MWRGAGRTCLHVVRAVSGGSRGNRVRWKGKEAPFHGCELDRKSSESPLHVVLRATDATDGKCRALLWSLERPLHGRGAGRTCLHAGRAVSGGSRGDRVRWKGKKAPFHGCELDDICQTSSCRQPTLM